jgi:hypothetical protein
VAGSKEQVPAQLILRMLSNAAKEPVPGSLDMNEVTMFQWSVAELLQRLVSDCDAPEADVAQLEWLYLPLLEHSTHAPVVLHRWISKRPSFFVEVLSAIYRPHSKAAPDKAQITEEVKLRASYAYRLLQSWQTVPGADDTGIDAEVLSAWVKEAHKLAVRAERGAVADQYIGRALSFSREGADGGWPDIAVRDIIDDMGNTHIESGLLVAVHNNRGFTCRNPLDGGKQERGLAQSYRNWASATKLEWPRTSALLERIACSWEKDARHYDEDAERTDWAY